VQGINEEDQRDPELLQMYFESFKHMTTLATATAVVVALVTERADAPKEPGLALAVMLRTFASNGR
jgi:hypothetical protein